MLITSSIAVVSLSGYLIFNPWNKESGTIEEEPAVPKAGVVIPVIEIHEEGAISIEEEMPFTMPEYAVQDAIHGMSHQKVKAEDKWGYIPMTHERISRLIAVVEYNENGYKNSRTYLDILNRWTNNDFSRVDEDHNAIWNIQDGNVGKATGIFTFEEEKAYIRQHFDIEVKDVTSD